MKFMVKRKSLSLLFCHTVYIHTYIHAYIHRGTIDAAMAVKDFVEKGLVAGDIIVLVRFDVKGVFDAAWWSSILK
jgi:hypothetical protein